MASFSIESNGRLENTAVYFNGEQLAGVREIFLNLDEDGTFDAILQYVGSDGETYTKQVFTEYLERVQITEPTITEEDAQLLRLLTVDSDGDIENTMVLLDEEPLDGLVSMMVHIKSEKAEKGGGIRSLFSKPEISERAEFRAEMTFRDEDDSLTTEQVF